MSQVSLEKIKKLRSKTKAGVTDCQAALKASQGNFDKAVGWLKKKGITRASKRAGREVSQGKIEVYSHGKGKIIGLIELLCETDFVARTEEFQKLAHELAMQVAAIKPKDKKEFLKQSYIRNEKVIIGDLIKEAIGKVGENIVIGRIKRFELGEKK